MSVVFNSVRPHRRQPTRLCRPWDSPGKNTGVGCHFLLQCIKVKSESEVAQSCPTLSDPMDCSLPGSFVHGIFQARVLEWGAIAFSDGKASACNVGDLGLIPALGRSPGEGNANPLQHSCLENPMDGGAWRLQVAKSQTGLSDYHSLIHEDRLRSHMLFTKHVVKSIGCLPSAFP